MVSLHNILLCSINDIVYCSLMTINGIIVICHFVFLVGKLVANFDYEDATIRHVSCLWLCDSRQMINKCHNCTVKQLASCYGLTEEGTGLTEGQD